MHLFQRPLFAPFARAIHERVLSDRAGDLTVLAWLLVAGLLVLGFLEVADEVQEGPWSLDERLLLALRNPADLHEGVGGQTLQSMVRDVTALGSGTLMGLFTAGLVVHLVLAGRELDAGLVLVAVLGCWLLNDALKELYARERPSVVPHMIVAYEPSFPSGHTMISATFYPTIAALAAPLLRRRRSRIFLMGLGFGLAALVGFSRLYLGVHYPSDVLAGLCVGVAWALLCGLAFRAVHRRRAAALERAALEGAQ